jgi:hypothetical protein
MNQVTDKKEGRGKWNEEQGMERRKERSRRKWR